MQWKLIAAGAVITVACSAGLISGRVQTAHAVAVQQQQQSTDEGALHRAALLPRSPWFVLHGLLRWIAYDDASGCFVFAPAAAVQFAQAAGQPDCPSAIHALHRQVRDVGSYLAPDVPENAYGYGQTTTVTGCTVRYEGVFTTATNAHPGPLLGLMVVTKPFPEGGYLITSYTPCAW